MYENRLYSDMEPVFIFYTGRFQLDTQINKGNKFIITSKIY